MPKPSSPGELVARLRAILRRVHPQMLAESQGAEAIGRGALTLWPGRRKAQWGRWRWT